MAKVKISDSLLNEIEKKFKGESHKVIDLLETLEENPKKGKFIAQVSGIVVKELKYESYRFYFITDNYKIRFLKIEDLKDLLIKFVRMSDKKTQQKTIDSNNTNGGNYSCNCSKTCPNLSCAEAHLLIDPLLPLFH